MDDTNKLPETHPYMVDTVFTGTLGLGMHNAVSAQHQSQVSVGAAMIATCSKLLDVGEDQSTDHANSEPGDKGVQSPNTGDDRAGVDPESSGEYTMGYPKNKTLRKLLSRFRPLQSQ